MLWEQTQVLMADTEEANNLEEAGLPEQSEEIPEGALISWMGWNNAPSGGKGCIRCGYAFFSMFQ